MRELIERCMQLHESTIPSWVKKAAKSKVVEGPNKSKAIAYEWKWMWDEVWSQAEDGVVGKRVSDWDNSMNCASCRRRIVHVYWVQSAEGEILPYGGDHLHIALGYPRELKKSQLDKLKAKITTERTLKRKEEEARELKKRYSLYISARSAPDIGAANRVFALSGGARGKSGPVFLLNKKDKAVMRGDDLIADRLVSYYPDWEVESPEKIRDFLEKNPVTGKR